MVRVSVLVYWQMLAHSRIAFITISQCNHSAPATRQARVYSAISSAQLSPALSTSTIARIERICWYVLPIVDVHLA